MYFIVLRFFKILFLVFLNWMGSIGDEVIWFVNINKFYWLKFIVSFFYKDN